MINAQTAVRTTIIFIGFTTVFIAILLFYQANITFYSIYESLMKPIDKMLTNPLASNATIDVQQHVSTSALQIENAVRQSYASQAFLLCTFILVCSGIAFRFENVISDFLRRSHRLFY
ncbi:hypothetical protein ACOMCU_00645 [Lysinibacillus sp. UGB7]|uniref:hypothetical protein n=1 Tax=Lysinibacillus sp. UGB7 TaxID=3411039 RepID=UPI003B825FD9